MAAVARAPAASAADTSDHASPGSNGAIVRGAIEQRSRSAGVSGRAVGVPRVVGAAASRGPGSCAAPSPGMTSHPAQRNPGRHQPRSSASPHQARQDDGPHMLERGQRPQLGGNLGIARRRSGVRGRRRSPASRASPYRAASPAQRSRHATGVASGASRWAPASQVSAQVRGTTRYTSYPPPPVQASGHEPIGARPRRRSGRLPIAVVVTRR